MNQRLGWRLTVVVVVIILISLALTEQSIGVTVATGVAMVIAAVVLVRLRSPFSPELSRSSATMTGHGEVTPDGDTAVLEFTRPRWAFVGGLTPYRVVIDGIDRCDAPRGRVVGLRVTPGPHVLMAYATLGRSQSEPHEITVQPGDVRTFIVDSNRQAWAELVKPSNPVTRFRMVQREHFLSITELPG